MTEQNGTGARRRAERSDKNSVRQTERDARALEWLSQMYGAPLDVTARLLGTSEGAAREVIRRWKAAGWAQSGKVDAGPAWVWPTRVVATQYLGWDPGTYRPRPTTAAHVRACGEVRLWLCGRELEGWTPEREIRHQAGWRQQGKRVEHIPDGIWHGPDGPVLIEVELTAKAPERMRDVLDEVLTAAERRGARIAYFAAPEAAAVVERARQSLMDEFSGTHTARGLSERMDRIKSIEEVRG